MPRKNILLITFILVALLQLFVPAKMIFDKEHVLDNGKAFKFRTEPIDPNDPFRGKFISLNYKANEFVVKNKENWLRGEDIYVSVVSDKQGFAEIKAVSRLIPKDDHDYVKAKIDYVSYDKNFNTLTIEYPFSIYYMEESKAFGAEVAYRQSQIDTNQVAYALVNVLDGETALKNVMINGRPIKEVVENAQAGKK